MSRIWLLILCTVPLAGCTIKAKNQFHDPVIQRIANLQDRRRTDSLLSYLKSDAAVNRRAASLAMASVQDTLASPFLGNLLLEDQDASVRKAAAIALGQTGGIAAINALIPALQDEDSGVIKETLEALGKVISKRDLNTLVEFREHDPLTSEGISWAICRAGMRNLTDSTLFLRESRFLESRHSLSTRQAAAMYFSRVKPFTHHLPAQLITTAQSDSSALVRMYVVSSLRFWKQPAVIAILDDIRTSDRDERVRMMAIRSLATAADVATTKNILKSLQDSTLSVRVAASEAMLQLSAQISISDIDALIVRETNGRILSNLWAVKLEKDSLHQSVTAIKALYAKASAYDKGWLLMTLSHAKGDEQRDAFEILVNESKTAESATIRTHAAEAFVELNRHAAFFNTNRKAFGNALEEIIGAGDPAVVGILSSAIADPTLNYRGIIHDNAFLKKAAASMQLPKDIESLQPLQDAIAWLESKPKPVSLKNGYNHPINWTMVKSIRSDQEVLVKTTKGQIVIRLFVEDAPGSVANFVELLNKHYFDGRFFHRVVPNFVIQTGCNRGDGYGSEAYSIRSEFSPRKYSTGSVGMASAGKDTEGTQWFITHAPTPHLDGRYTLFAEVTNGMDVVDQIQVGDKIESMSLIEP